MHKGKRGRHNTYPGEKWCVQNHGHSGKGIAKRETSSIEKKERGANTRAIRNISREMGY
jgi:hypothetical protein